MAGIIEFNQLITPDGAVYNLDSGGGSRWVMSHEGWGMPQIDYLTHRDPQGGSEYVVDYRLRPRSISLMLRQNFCDRAAYWAGRADLLDVIRFNQGAGGASVPVTLRRSLADGSRRDLAVYIVSGPAFTPQASTQWDQWSFTEALRFVAYDPIIYDPATVTTSFTLSALTGLVFPITFPITFGSNSIDASQNITYAGTWLEYPIIMITGPLNSPIITNLTTGEVIALTYVIPAGRVVTIDLAYGHKSVMDDLGSNLIGTVTPESDLGTWHLAAAPGAAGGVNVIQVQGTQAVPGVTEVSIRHQSRYIGI